MHNASTLKADCLRQQKTLEQTTEAKIGTGSAKLDNQREEHFCFYMVRIWQKKKTKTKHASINPFCRVSMVHAGGSVVWVWGIFCLGPLVSTEDHDSADYVHPLSLKCMRLLVVTFKLPL